MKIYKGDMTIECSAEEFSKIKDDLLDAEEETVKCEIPLFGDFDSIIDKFYSSLYKSPNIKKENEKMAKSVLTDEEVEVEIERLKQSEFVKLARKAERIKYKRKQRLYQYQWFENRGKELAKQGYTLDNIAERMGEENDEID